MFGQQTDVQISKSLFDKSVLGQLTAQCYGLRLFNRGKSGFYFTFAQYLNQQCGFLRPLDLIIMHPDFIAL